MLTTYYLLPDQTLAKRVADDRSDPPASLGLFIVSIDIEGTPPDDTDDEDSIPDIRVDWQPFSGDHPPPTWNQIPREQAQALCLAAIAAAIPYGWSPSDRQLFLMFLLILQEI